VTSGRHFAADALAAWGMSPAEPDPPVRDDILLVTAELLSNAIKACSEAVTLSLEGHYRRVDISVVDDNPALAARLPTSTDTPGGRGLLIVDALSQHWGQRPLDERSKEVWAQVAIPAHAPLAAGCRLAPPGLRPDPAHRP
jgi:hypothetical protein